MATQPLRTGSDAQAGYTLIELLVVLVVIGLLITGVPVLLRTARPGAEADAAAQAMLHDLRDARASAILRGKDTRVVFDARTERYVSGGRVHVLPRGLPFAVRDITGKTASSEIRFYADGSSTGGTILIGQGRGQHRIVSHWLSGRITLDE